MTTAAAKATGSTAEKEKVEKRRALGRGLESLLPGPRVVVQSPPFAKNAKDGARSDVSEPQVPSVHSVNSRNDNLEKADATPGAPEPGTVPFIHAVAEDAASETAELRSAWPGQRPSSTQSQPVAATDSHPVAESATRVGQPPREEESITILTQAETRPSEKMATGNLVINLAIGDIDKNPYQTRYVESDEKLEELTNSIKANGVLQPIVVRPAEEEGRYILILGERRLHASKLAGKDTVPALVRRVSVQQAAEMTIVENLQREDLSPLEQAEAFRVLSEDFKLTQAEIGEKVGLSRVSVANYMRLLRLPREVMQLLAEKRIKFAEAKELLKLEDNDQITKAALFAVKKGMTVEQVEQLVMRMGGWLDPIPGMPGTERKKSGARWVDPNVRAAQMELERMLGLKVRIRDRKGKGKIVIEYSTVDDYERVVGMLKGK
jgi:ParB family transcriptional regulator, chromosome partitioning protein